MSRFNPIRQWGALSSCQDDDAKWQLMSEVIQALNDNGIMPRPRTDDEAETTSGGFYQFPTSNPQRAKVRFKLTGAFAGGVAPAIVVDAGASALSPSEAIQVVDTYSLYGSAAGTEYGYADIMPDGDGGFQNEVTTLHGVGSPTGTDNYTIKFVDATDTAGFFEAKMENAVAGGTYDPLTDALVYSEVVTDGIAAGSDSLLFFVDASSITAANDKVKVSATDSTSDYLEDSFQDLEVVAFNSTVHNKVYFTNNGDANEQLIAYTYKTAESGKVRVSSGDTLAYLEDQFTSVTDGTYNPSTHVPVFVDKSGGTSLQIYIDGKVKVNSTDDMDYLADQFYDWESGTTYDSDFDDLVIVNTYNPGGLGQTDELRLYVPRETILVKLTGDVPARSGTTLGCLSGANVEWVVKTSGTCGGTPVVGSQGPAVNVIVYNPSLDAIEASSGTPIYLPAWKWDDGYLLAPLDLWQLGGRVTANAQSIGHDASDVNEWQDDGEC